MVSLNYYVGKYQHIRAGTRAINDYLTHSNLFANERRNH